MCTCLITAVIRQCFSSLQCWLVMGLLLYTKIFHSHEYGRLFPRKFVYTTSPRDSGSLFKLTDSKTVLYMYVPNRYQSFPHQIHDDVHKLVSWFLFIAPCPLALSFHPRYPLSRCYNIRRKSRFCAKQRMHFISNVLLIFSTTTAKNLFETSTLFHPFMVDMNLN